MATSPKSAEPLPKKKDSVLLKPSLSVIENPPKKVVLAKESSSETAPADHQPADQQTDMEIDGMTDDVIGPSNQT